MVDLRLGDCLSVLPTLGAGSVDAVVTDLPYGITQCRWDSPIPFPWMWGQVKRLLAPGGVAVFTASQPFTSALVMSNPDWFRHEWVWIKNRGGNFANTAREPMKEHESVLVFSPGKWTYNPRMQERAPSGLSRSRYAYKGTRHSDCYGRMPDRGVRGELRVPSSWQKFNCEAGLHPTQKPVALMSYLVETYTNPGDTVLDFCAGSGTTLVACARTGRDAVGVERDPAYHEIARKRIAEAQGPLFATG